MKKAIFLIVLCLIMILFSSCALQTDIEESTTETLTNETETEDILVKIEKYFDSELTHKPTYEQVASIEKGMKIDEIIDRLGKPHRFGPTSGVPSLEWETNDGYICWIIILCSDGFDANMHIYDALMTYGVALNINISESVNVSDEDFFDAEMTSKPTNAEMKLIKEGMPFNSVIGIIGRPHGYADGASMSYFKWITTEGDTYIMLFSPPENIENPEEMSLSEYYSHTAVAFDPRS